MTDIKLLLLYSNTLNHLTVCQKISSDSFKNVKYKMYMDKEDLALNSLKCKQNAN